MAAETTPTIPEGYVYVADLADLPARGKRTVTIAGKRVLIVMCETGPYAVEDKCPQTGRSIAHGKVLQCEIVAPTNGARYDLATGRYLGGGQSWFQSHWLTTWPLLVRDGALYVQPPDA